MKATLSTTGIERLVTRYERRANFLGGGMRAILDSMRPSLIAALQSNIDSFTPGEVRDLSEKYKLRKLKKYGRIYPILMGSGSMYNSMRVTLVSPSGGSGWVFKLTFSGNDKYGKANASKAEGHLTGYGHLPKRDFTKNIGDWKQAVRETIRSALREE